MVDPRKNMKRHLLDVVDDEASDFAYPIDSAFLSFEVCMCM
jgi:hypothetical protein